MNLISNEHVNRLIHEIILEVEPGVVFKAMDSIPMEYKDCISSAFVYRRQVEVENKGPEFEILTHILHLAINVLDEAKLTNIKLKACLDKGYDGLSSLTPTEFELFLEDFSQQGKWIEKISKNALAI